MCNGGRKKRSLDISDVGPQNSAEPGPANRTTQILPREQAPLNIQPDSKQISTAEAVHKCVNPTDHLL